MRRSLGSACVLLAVAVLSGCEPKIYRAETVVFPDGRVSRAVYQPDDETPQEARSAAWESVTFAPRVRHEEWDQPIRELRAAVRDKDRPYFAAWGEFASSAEVPGTFREAAPEGMSDGTLRLDYQREDFVLAIEHRWNETLTDIVTLDDMQRARQELADVLVPTFEKIVSRGLGQEYDTSALSRWLRESGKPVAFELTDVMFDLGARGALSSTGELDKALVSVLQRQGVSVHDEAGNLLSDEALSAAVVSHLRRVLLDNLRRHDGQPVRPAVADEILQWLGVMDVPEGMEKSERYDEAAKQVVAEDFGSEEGLAAVIKPLGQRIGGLYRGVLFGPGGRAFEYTLEMPGVIVESSGVLLTENITRFRFADGDAYPFGYAMRARSLEATPAAAKFLDENPQKQREQLLAYLELVRDDAKLRQLVGECVAVGNLEPLRRTRDATASASRSTNRYDLLLKILGSGAGGKPGT